MNAYRDPLPHEAEQYREAIAQKNVEQLQRIMTDLYPNVIWGTVTQTLSEFDRAWVMKHLVASSSADVD
jgi:hypothetical protein